MGYYYSNEEALDLSGVFPTLKGAIAAAEGVSERDNVSLKVYAQTSNGDMLVGMTDEYEIEDGIGTLLTFWVFDFDEDWPFSKEY